MFWLVYHDGTPYILWMVLEYIIIHFFQISHCYCCYEMMNTILNNWIEILGMNYVTPIFWHVYVKIWYVCVKLDENNNYKIQCYVISVEMYHILWLIKYIDTLNWFVYVWCLRCLFYMKYKFVFLFSVKI